MAYTGDVRILQNWPECAELTKQRRNRRHSEAKIWCRVPVTRWLFCWQLILKTLHLTSKPVTVITPEVTERLKVNSPLC